MRSRKIVSARRVVALLVFASTLVFSMLVAIPTASAAYTGLLTPTAYAGVLDLNGDGAGDGADDWTAFYGDTSIIDGKLDCDAWGATENDGGQGDGTIDGSDNCFMRGYDGSPTGDLFEVSSGVFIEINGFAIGAVEVLPSVWNASDPDNPSVFDSDFAWQAIDGRVDANGNNGIDGDDCTIGIVGGGNILSEGAGSSCGMAGGPYTAADNGLVDLNNSLTITTADDCSNGCFLGQDVVDGFVGGLPVPAPIVTSINPTSGNVGISAHISGSNLLGASVTFSPPLTNAVESNITSTGLDVTVPNISTGAKTVTVTTPGGSDTIGFTVTNLPAPNATSISPTSGPVGTVITITGTNLTGVTGVTIGGVAASFGSNTATSVVATVPASLAPGPHAVVVSTGGGSDGVGNFTVVAAPNATTMSPTSGPVGTVVTITGTNLANAQFVRFNGVAATITSNSATQIVVTVPSGATTGPVTVQTAGGTDGVGTFTVTQVAPTITGFHPDEGKVGKSVTINGSNFTGTTVRFGGVSATFVINSLTQITAIVPAGAGTGPIQVTTAAGTATSSQEFVVKHDRNVTLHFSKARGNVTVVDGWDACGRLVPVRIQYFFNGKFRNVQKGLTKTNGAYGFGGIHDPGRYRVIVKPVTLSSGDICRKDVSPTVRL